MGFSVLLGILIMVLCIGWISQTQAAVRLPSSDLPPESDPPDCDGVQSLYKGTSLHAMFPGAVAISNPIHKCFTDVEREGDGMGNEIERFNSTLEGTIDLGFGPATITLNGPVQTAVYGLPGQKVGTFAASYVTEIDSMLLSGSAEGHIIRIRESPSKASTGQTTITPVGGGMYDIDSFFDVYTELSVDYGPWVAQTNPAGRMTLVPASTVPVRSSTWSQIKALYE
jgi:hypothetical protein